MVERKSKKVLRRECRFCNKIIDTRGECNHNRKHVENGIALEYANGLFVSIKDLKKVISDAGGMAYLRSHFYNSVNAAKMIKTNPKTCVDARVTLLALSYYLDLIWKDKE